MATMRMSSDQLVQDLTLKTPWRSGAQAIRVLLCLHSQDSKNERKEGRNINIH